MKYISTRGLAPELGFCDTVMAGMADDGGLYVPAVYPIFPPEKIASMAGLSYTELFFEVTKPYIGDEIPEKDLRKIIEDSYSTFRHEAIAPLKQLGNQEFLLELFHGPTMAFKDFALQFLGRIFDYILKRSGEKVVVVGATSGDTGSAAIEGCRHCKQAEIYILHPYNRVSLVQRRQMTTILDDNVHNLAVEGNFDDCQHIIKELFADRSFLKGRRLVAVNSINWCRIMAQVVYYFYAALQLGAPARNVAFSVPTGNFGDIFAGYIAHKMGLPIKQLVIATNKNDILHRFLSENDYSRAELKHTISPSMDIQVASNFERLVFDLYGNDGKAISSLMDNFKKDGKITIKETNLARAREIFSSFNVNEAATAKTISDIYSQTGEVLDPHSAIGVCAARKMRKYNDIPMVTLATAHPAKFPDAVEKAGLPRPPLPPAFQNLLKKEERFRVVGNSVGEVREVILL